MSRFLQLVVLALFVLSVSCEKEEETEVKIPSELPNESFSEAVVKSKNTSLDYETRLDGANLAYSIATRQQADSLLIIALDRKTLLHNKLSQADSAILYSQELLHLVKKHQDSSGIGKTYFKLALYNEAMLKKDSAYFYYNESKKAYEALKDSINVVKKIRNMAIMLSRSGNYTQSTELAIEGLSFLEYSDDDESKGSLLNCIAINGKNQQEFDETLYWYKQAYEATSNTKHKYIYLSNMANIYREIKNYSEAIRLYKEVLKAPEIANDPKEYARVLGNFSYTQWLVKRDDESLSSLKKALSLKEDLKHIRGQISSHEHLTLVYLESDLNKAEQHAQKMLQLANKSSSVQGRVEALRLLMKASVNKPNTYATYAKKYIYLTDSIQKKSSILGGVFAMIKYDASQKRSENELLKTQSIEEQLKLEKSKRMNSIYIALGVISLFVFAFIILVLRERYQKEKLQEVVITESRISKKVHDEVANDVYLVMSKLEKENTANEHLLQDLDGIYNKTRDISREHSALDLDQDFGELVSDLLMSFKSTDVNIITKGLKQITWQKISPLKKTAIFRVIQELMTNMSKHSEAQIVILTFDNVKNKVLIKYSDDGVGCSIKKNNGLLNAENRILSLRGKFTLQSEKNKGFKATIIV